MLLSPVVAAALEAGETVLTSSARASRALRRLHGEMQRAQGLSAWQSADILDWDSWLGRQWQKHLRSGTEPRLLLTALQEQQVWTRVIKPDIEGRRLISVESVSLLAQQAYALLCEYGALDFLRGDRAGGSDVESFCVWARSFEQLCRKESWLSRSMLPLVLREAIPVPRNLLLVGFDRTTPAQRDLLETLRQQGSSITFATTTEAPYVERTPLVEAGSTRDEIITCALWLQSELFAASQKGYVPRLAVVVPGAAAVRPEMERIFRQILAPASIPIGSHETSLPFEFSLGVPLAGVPMVRAALLLLRWLLEPLPQDQVTWLMLSGFLWEQESDLLSVALFDSRLRRQSMLPPEQELLTFLHALQGSWIEARPLAALSSRLEAAWRAHRGASPGQTLGFAAWVERTQDILQAVHWPGPRALASEGFQALAKWSQLQDQLAMLSFDGRSVTYSEFVTVLEREAGQTIFAPESHDAPVQILGPFEAAGLEFDALWFLGADDQSWPVAARPHPFLTRAVQVKHAMPHSDLDADFQLAAQVTARLASSATVCIVSYPVQNKDGGCRPSPLVSQSTQRIPSLQMRAHAGAGGYEDELSSPPLPDFPDPSRGLVWPVEQNAGGADTLKWQAACPFRAFATVRLGTHEMDRRDWGLAASERGNVLHKVMQKVWDELKTKEELSRVIREGTLTGLVESQVAHALAVYQSQPGAQKDSWSRAYLQAEQERITVLIEDWLHYEETRLPFAVEAGEKQVSAAVGKLKLDLRVDRIDTVPGGRLIIDYKTGVVKPAGWDEDRPDEPQLPLYAAYSGVEQVKGVLVAQVRTGDSKLFGRAESVVFGGRPPAIEQFTSAMQQHWQQVLLKIGQDFLNGEAQVAPKQYPETCKFCPLPGLCRVAETGIDNTEEETEEGYGE